MPSAQHTITEVASAEQIAQRLDLLKRGLNPDDLLADEDTASIVFEDSEPEHSSGQHYYKPWAEAADDYITWAQSPHLRVYTGIDEFDDAMRGLAPAELMLVVGYAHSGKTVFTTQMLLHNHSKRVAVFTPDETRVLVLVKMASILHGISAEEIEERLAAGDSFMEEMLRDVATEHFPQFAVFDEISDLGAMDRALNECESVWGDHAQLVVIDYAQLVTGVGEDVPSIMSAVKGWGKRRQVPLVVLHQASRSSGAAGRKMSIDSGGYGGEQQATFLIGVRRKAEQYKALIEDIDQRIAQSTSEATIQRLQDARIDAEYELQRHRHTITFNLPKNKRPPSRKVDDTDFLLDTETGRVRRFEGEAPRHARYEQAEF